MIQVKTNTLRFTGLIGASLFLFVFLLTFHVPEWVETFAFDFIEKEVTTRIDTTIDSIQPPQTESTLGRLAQNLFSQNQERIDEIKFNIKNEAHTYLSDVLANIRNVDCECREKYTQMFLQGMATEISLLEEVNEQLITLIESTYMKVSFELKRDIRIFTGTNSVVFILLILVSFIKPAAINHLYLPCALLVLSTLVCSYFYIFAQNWLLTIIYSDYVGFYYLGYLGFVFLLLCDVVFNRARVTTEILNTTFSVIGSSLQVVALPC